MSDWLGLDLSQNITPPRAPCGANNRADNIVFGRLVTMLFVRFTEICY